MQIPSLRYGMTKREEPSKKQRYVEGEGLGGADGEEELACVYEGA
jgi:hypothetical protein